MSELSPRSPTATTTEEEKKKTFTKEDFEFGEALGEGAYSRVVLGTFKHTGKKYAMKIIQKQMILSKDKVKTVKMEKQVLHMMDHPNIIKLFCTFQDKECLYFALEFAPGGELFSYIHKYGKFSYQAAQFYAAEIVVALEYMHSLGIIHRDMKPENVILSKDMHVKLTDFGTAKIKGVNLPGENEQLMKRKHKQTFVGTAEYVSPEVLKDEPCTEGSDLWALGCMIYQFLTSKHPFKAESEYLIFQKILKRELEFPQDFPPDAQDIVEKLLQLLPDDRLGMGEGGYVKLKTHPFFQGVNWNSLNEQTPPPLVPHQTPYIASIIDPKILQEMQENWKQFLVRNENVVYTSFVAKRRRLSVKKRQLILTDKPRFVYVDINKGTIKGTIAWTNDITVEKKSDKDFTIKTPGRDYIIEDLGANADAWVKAINGLKAKIASSQK